MRIYKRLCYLCYIEGNEVPAVASYFPKGKEFDICLFHSELCKNDGHEVVMFEEGDEIIEED